MALVTCEECGKQISDKAKVCPNCGNPIEAIKMAEIDEQNRQYFKKYNKEQLLFNIIGFIGAILLGYNILSGEFAWWKIGTAVASTLGFLVVSISWVQWVIALTIATQRYKHIPRWMILITCCLGYSIGAIIGLKS